MKAPQSRQRRSLRKPPPAPASHLAPKQPNPDPRQLELFPFLDGAARLRPSGFGEAGPPSLRRDKRGTGGEGENQGEEGPQECARGPKEPL